MEEEINDDNILEVYGTSWCLKSAKIRNYLQSKWITFNDYDVEEDVLAEARVRALYDGKLKFPTIIYKDTHLKNPSIKALDKLLETIDDL